MSIELLRRYTLGECAGPHTVLKGRSVGLSPTIRTGYPHAWSKCSACGGSGEDHFLLDDCRACQGTGSIKDLVRKLAEHRCERCQHPFKVGESGEWTERSWASFKYEIPDAPALFNDVGPEDAGKSMPSARAVLWSDCDERCTHGGPIRYKLPAGEGDGEWRISAADEVPFVGPVSAVQASWRILTVHHLTNEKADCRWWNLAALCQRCHLEIQGKVNMAQLWPFAHTEWFKPHAAGYYAATYLREDLGRAEVEERQGELLALEQMA